MVCLVVSSLLLIWSGGCREGLCDVFGYVVFVIDLVRWVSSVTVWCVWLSSCYDLVRWVVRDCVVCLVVSSLLLIWSGGCREGVCGGGCREGLCGVFGCVVFVIDLVRWVS